MYPEQLVAPMKAELTGKGFTELLTAEEVDNTLIKEGTTLVMINSVCGCSARMARPAVLAAVAQGKKKPDRLTTTFAGFDLEGVQQVRTHLMPYPPSSPSIALFKDGKLVHFVERSRIEGYPAEAVAQNLLDAFEEYC